MIMRMCTCLLGVLSITRRLAVINRLYFGISVTEKCWLWLEVWRIL